MFVQELVVNGAPSGEMGAMMETIRWEPGLLRPFVEDDPSHPLRGRVCAIINTGRKKLNNVTNKYESVYKQYTVAQLQAKGIHSPVFVNNATALPKESWLQLDRTAIEAARYRTTCWDDLRAVSTYTLNGMSKMILEHETISDVGVALQDMDGTGDGRNTMPLRQLEGLPLPITYAGWDISQRKLAISRASGTTSIDTTMAENSGRRIGEMLEKQSIGVQTGLVYGGNSTQVGGYGQTSAIYGMVNHPQRLTKVNLRKPSQAAWTPDMLVTDFLACLNQLKTRKQFGEFTVYLSNDWDQYLDGDYYSGSGSALAPTQTVRKRLLQIEGISAIKRLDFLFAAVPTANAAASDYYGPGGEGYNGNYPFTMVFAKNDPMTRRAVSGMGVTTVQWESKGGAILHFRTMCIEAPQYFADYYGNMGLLHANASSSPI